LYVVDGTYKYVMKITIVIAISIFTNGVGIRLHCWSGSSVFQI
jgi:hypothetical protein